MLGLLVETLHGQAYRIFPSPGDWGIDVFVGDLDGHVTIWQAKYFVNGIRGDQLRQVESSFEQACQSACEHDYRVDRWVLCVPDSMTGHALQRWQRWRSTQQDRTGVAIELWDDNTLRRLLLRPEAGDIVRSFYHPYVDPQPASAEPRLRIQPDEAVPAAGTRGWRGGDELRLDTACYLLHDPVDEDAAPDRSWVLRDATADQIEPTFRRVRVRQIIIGHSTPAARERRDGLHAQAGLLASLGGSAGLPRLLTRHEANDRTTLVTSLPVAPSYRELYRAGQEPLDRLAAADALATAVPVCQALARLHGRAHAHRALTMDAIIVTHPRRGMLRDIGLAGFAARPGEGGSYQAPEQRRLTAAGRRPVGPATDVYQVAALLLHTLTGLPPAGGASPPVGATIRACPVELDEILARSLDPDPDGRPKILDLAEAFRAARRRLSVGDQP